MKYLVHLQLQQQYALQAYDINPLVSPKQYDSIGVCRNGFFLLHISDK